jgi:2-hydroxychromene-2-carboxylate isomerase
MARQKIRHYMDYKSPYAYLAQGMTYALERDTGAEVEWVPYTLDIPAFLGSARLGEDKSVVAAERNAHQWRRVRYLYMDCRREANKLGLTIRGPRKIFDSSLANAGLLFARDQGGQAWRGYNDRVFERFWKRELDIEDRGALAAVLTEVGLSTHGFDAFLDEEGPARLKALQDEAEAAGVFGVPSWMMEDGELFWGREHMPRIRELAGAAA